MTNKWLPSWNVARSPGIKLIASAWLLGLLHLTGPFCHAHPFHTSLAEMEWNSQSGCWEVGLRLYASDLESAVNAAFPSPLELDGASVDRQKTAALLQNYLSHRFYLAPKGMTAKVGQRAVEHATEGMPTVGFGIATVDEGVKELRSASEMRWVGYEMEGSWVWVYFELIPANAQSDLVLVHPLLMDVNEDQINVISVRNGKRRYTLQTHRQQKWIELESTQSDFHPSESGEAGIDRG